MKFDAESSAPNLGLTNGEKKSHIMEACFTLPKNSYQRNSEMLLIFL